MKSHEGTDRQQPCKQVQHADSSITVVCLLAGRLGSILVPVVCSVHICIHCNSSGEGQSACPSLTLTTSAVTVNPMYKDCADQSIPAPSDVCSCTDRSCKRRITTQLAAHTCSGVGLLYDPFTLRCHLRVHHTHCCNMFGCSRGRHSAGDTSRVIKQIRTCSYSNQCL